MTAKVPAARSVVKETVFSRLFSWRDATIFALVYVIAVAHHYLMSLVLVALLLWAISGLRQAFCAMSLLSVLRLANPGFASFSAYDGALFWLIMIAGSIRLYAHSRTVPASYYWLAAFSCLAIILSILVSTVVGVSVMKAVSLFIFIGAILLASENLSRSDLELLQRWFFSSILVVAIFSLLTLAAPSIAFKVNGQGFQGILSHPQQLGVILAPFVSWAVVRAFDNRSVRSNPMDLFIIFAGIAIIVMSRARTAMLATFMSVALAIAIHLLQTRKASLRKSFSQIAGLSLLVSFLIFVVSLSTGGVSALVEDIVFKGSGTETVAEAFEQSRGAGVAQHLENFADAPLTGHGFGVYRFGVFGGEEKIVRIMGIPISAPAEKGFAFTAVLEEVGIVGGLLFYGWVISMARQSARSPRPEVLAMFFGAVLINFGETVIFSPGGIGLLMWLIIAISLAAGRLDEQKA